MEDKETARMRKYGESKMTRIMMATVPHVISGLGLRKFQADGFLLTRVYMATKITGPDGEKNIAKMSGPETLSLQVKHTVVKLNYHLYSYGDQ